MREEQLGVTRAGRAHHRGRGQRPLRPRDARDLSRGLQITAVLAASTDAAAGVVLFTLRPMEDVRRAVRRYGACSRTALCPDRPARWWQRWARGSTTAPRIR